MRIVSEMIPKKHGFMWEKKFMLKMLNRYDSFHLLSPHHDASLNSRIQ